MLFRSLSRLAARTDCGPSAAGLSRGSKHAHPWESIYRWNYAAVKLGDPIAICTAPTDAAGGKAVLAGAETACPGGETSVSDRILLPGVSALGTGRRIWSVLREADSHCLPITQQGCFLLLGKG